MSLLDRIEALPAELVHKIFEHYWDFSTNKILYQLKMKPREVFSIGTKRESLNIGRITNRDHVSPYDDGRVEENQMVRARPT